MNAFVTYISSEISRFRNVKVEMVLIYQSHNMYIGTKYFWGIPLKRDNSVLLIHISCVEIGSYYRKLGAFNVLMYVKTCILGLWICW